jgi:hypothetical protein
MTATGYLTNFGANTGLDATFPTSAYLGCFSDDPTPLGSGSSELLGGTYARQPISFAVASNRAKVSVNAQVFTGLLASAVPYFAVATALTGGNLVAVNKLDTPVEVDVNGQLVVAVGDIAFAY